jgi:hypothetical protein
MNKQQLGKMREDAVDRLVRGEDADTLQAELAVRLGHVEALRTMTAVRLRAEEEKRRAEDHDRWVSEQPATPVSTETADPLWTGPTKSRAHAERIIKAVAQWSGSFIAVGLASEAFHWPPDPAVIVIMLIFAAFVAGLWKSRSAIAAGALVTWSGLFCALLIMGCAIDLADQEEFNIRALFYAIASVFVLRGAVRAFSAARFLRRKQDGISVVEIFD